MNPLLNKLQLYPFEKLKNLLSHVTPNANYHQINLSIGEPQHATPTFIKNALSKNLSGLSNYPNTNGLITLRQAIANWLQRRYKLTFIDPDTQILPVNGSREALFSLTQTIIDSSKKDALVCCPNPFYQIYEGAALLAGAQPYFINANPELNFLLEFQKVPNSIWTKTQLLFVCTPNNPTGNVLSLSNWKTLFDLSDRYNFIIASDECYSEIYFQEHAPLGALQAAYQLHRTNYSRLIVLSSLSKRSNVPGMRSGFVAGDAIILKKFLLYRTYHGSAMSPAIQNASIAAWNDEKHVQVNRIKYAQKFQKITPLLQKVLNVSMPNAGFYLWARIDHLENISDLEYVKRLYIEYNVITLPGSYLMRFNSTNTTLNDKKYIRLALVANLKECLEAVKRIVVFTKKLTHIHPTLKIS